MRQHCHTAASTRSESEGAQSACLPEARLLPSWLRSCSCGCGSGAGTYGSRQRAHAVRAEAIRKALCCKSGKAWRVPNARQQKRCAVGRFVATHRRLRRLRLAARPPDGSSLAWAWAGKRGRVSVSELGPQYRCERSASCKLGGGSYSKDESRSSPEFSIRHVVNAGIGGRCGRHQHVFEQRLWPHKSTRQGSM